jgi:hypothetical protein
LRELRKLRLIRFKDADGLGQMDTLVSVLRPILSFVSDEALQDVLRTMQEPQSAAPQALNTAQATDTEAAGGA